MRRSLVTIAHLGKSLENLLYRYISRLYTSNLGYSYLTNPLTLES